MSRKAKIACAQMHAGEDREANIAKAFRFMAEAKAAGAEVICFPELFLEPFFPQYRCDMRYFDLAESIPGPTVERFQAKCRELNLAAILNIYEKGEIEGIYYDTSPVIGADGALLGSQRMMHVAEDDTENERFYYKVGNNGFQIFRTANLTFGVGICYDRHFPEFMRIMALKGAQAVFVATATGGIHKSPWFVEAQASSVFNGIFVIHANKVGKEGNLDFFGLSLATNPLGQVIGQASEDREEVFLAELDLDLIRTARHNWPFMRDRRPEMYGDLLK